MLLGKGDRIFRGPECEGEFFLNGDQNFSTSNSRLADLKKEAYKGSLIMR